MNILAIVRQPSTLIAAGLIVGAAVYYATGSAELTLLAAAVIPGAVNDQTKALLTKIEALEDAIKSTQKSS